MDNLLFSWDDFLSKALTTKSVTAVFQSSISPNVFGSIMLGNIWRLLSDHFKEFNRCPTEDEMYVSLRKLPDAEKGKTNEYIDKIYALYNQGRDLSVDIVISETTEMLKTVKMREYIMQLGRLYEAGDIDYDSALENLKGITNIAVDTTLGIELNNNKDNIKEVVERTVTADRKESFPSGIKTVDELLGGFYKGELTICMAPSNRGKSVFLVNHAVAAAAARKNVVLITAEMAVDAVLDRVIRRITGKNRQEARYDLRETAQHVQAFFDFADTRMFVKYVPPGECTVNQIEAYLDQLESVTDFKADVVVVDYLDELAANSEDRRKDTRHQHRSIARALATLAKTRNIGTITATQTNRDALEKRSITEKNIGEDYGKFQVADCVYAICQDDDEASAGTARLRWIKVRDEGGKGKEIPVRVNFDIMLVEAMINKYEIDDSDIIPLEDE